MNFDLSAIPTTIDAIHLGLGISSVLFLGLFLTKKKTPEQPSEPAPEVIKEVEVVKEVEVIKEVEVVKEVEVIKEVAVTETVVLKESTPEAALQLLTLLQQDARFIDFIQEDLSGYSDADIGAAARVVHEGSKKTLDNYFTLESIRNEDEETSVRLEEGFNASEVRLTGNVVGKAPFNGTLIHKGWKVTQVKLPKLVAEHDATIVAPAEVEL